MNRGKESSGNPSIEELLKENQSLREQLNKAQAEIERLRKALEEALRSLKRQAAPFSKGQPKTNPKRPGRKSGSDYGQRGFRAVPDHVDEQIAVSLPKRCPDCGGRVVHDRTHAQFQEDIVRQTIVRRFDVETGHCESCGGHVQGRHPLQTSDALAAAQVQVGPAALTLAAHMERLLSKTFRNPANRRRAKHLRHEEPWLFTFLYCPGIEATNHAAERALRPAGVARKTWGGNRTANGAKTQQILISILTTCRQQGKDSLERITELFLSPTPIVLDLVPNTS